MQNQGRCIHVLLAMAAVIWTTGCSDSAQRAAPMTAKETAPPAAEPPPPPAAMPTMAEPPAAAGESPAPVASLPTGPDTFSTEFRSSTSYLVATETAVAAVDDGGPDHIPVPVLYATDRKPVMPLSEWRKNLRAIGSDYAYYGADWGELELGQCVVSIPRKAHRVGEVERPSIWKLEFKENVDKHFMLQSLTPLDPEEFFGRANRFATNSPEQDAFVFIHGYNVAFADAVFRTAQLTYDLEFRGAPILYSWPSRGIEAAYLRDADSVKFTEPHLKQFLRDLRARLQARRIHLVAHSMGNRALTEVIKALAAEAPDIRFNQIILAAPDVNRDIFLRDIVSAIKQVGKRVTLYASSKDRALQLSDKLSTFPRLGESGNKLVVVPGIDSIDASDVDTDMLGHSYFAVAQRVVRDIEAVVCREAPMNLRTNLLAAEKNGLPYWKVIP